MIKLINIISTVLNNIFNKIGNVLFYAIDSFVDFIIKNKYIAIFAKVIDNLILLIFNIDMNEIYYKDEDMYTSQEVKVLIESLNKMLEQDDGLVINIFGKWGIGKTYFWKYYSSKYLTKHDYVYISLFGVHSLKDIKQKIYLKIKMPNLIGDKTERIVPADKFIEKYIGFNYSDFLFTLALEKVVICFDDFERMSKNLNISEVLGLISELKEQHRCKVVIISNSDSLEEQDKLNHKKILRTSQVQDTKYDEKFIITQTNNQEIFDKYTEKIIDYQFLYSPHKQDLLQILKEKKYNIFDWKFIEDLIEEIEDDNKEFNLRLYKKFLNNLKIFNSAFNEKINMHLQKQIITVVFQKSFDIKIKDHNFININMYGLEEIIVKALKQNFLDDTIFNDKLIRFNNHINNTESEQNFIQKCKEIYFKYLYELEYDDFTFISDFYNLLNKNVQNNIPKSLSLTTFEWYIDLMKKISGKEQIYDKLFITAMKIYIDELNKEDFFLSSFEYNDEESLIDKYPELKEYYEKVFTKHEIQQMNTNTIKPIMASLREKNEWSKEDETLLNSIEKNQHIEWLKSDTEYLEICFHFLRYINGYSGDKPFNNAYCSIINSLQELSEKDKYKNKLELMLNNLGFDKTKKCE